MRSLEVMHPLLMSVSCQSGSPSAASDSGLHVQVRLYNNRGYCLAKLGKYRAAVADYNKVLELDQTNCHAYHNRLANQLCSTSTACLGLPRASDAAWHCTAA